MVGCVESIGGVTPSIVVIAEVPSRNAHKPKITVSGVPAICVNASGWP